MSWGGPPEWKLGPSRGKKVLTFPGHLLSVSSFALSVSNLQLPQRGKPTFTVTSARGNQPSWQLCVPAEWCLWQPLEQRVSERQMAGRAVPPLQGPLSLLGMQTPLHQHNQHHGPRQPALHQCLSCCRTKGWGTGTSLPSPLHTAGIELNSSENQS